MRKQTNSSPHNFKTGMLFQFTSKWKSMILPFIGKLIVATIVAIYAASFFIMKTLAADDSLSRGEGNASVSIILITVLLGWFITYVIFFPKKWRNIVMLDLKEEKIIIKKNKETLEYNFSDIEEIRYKAISSIFNTSFLYFFKVRQNEEPLIALSDRNTSNEFFFMLKRRTSLNIIQ